MEADFGVLLLLVAFLASRNSLDSCSKIPSYSFCYPGLMGVSRIRTSGESLMTLYSGLRYPLWSIANARR